jgi:ferredoxin-NADP reductase
MPDKIRARLENKVDLAEGLTIFRVAFDETFEFAPGQYATLWLTHQGKTVPRPYSIASSPSEKHALEFYINLVAEGQLTPSLWDPEVLRALRNGDAGTELSISGPKGHFVLDTNDARDLVFVASGTGLAPFISMTRSLNEEFLADPKSFRARRIYLIHGVSYSNNLGYREELEALARETLRDPQRKLGLIYLPTISRPHMDPEWRGLTGRAESLFDDAGSADDEPMDVKRTLKGMLRSLLHPERHVVYVCGHPGTIDNTVQTLSGRGFRDKKDLKFEKYYT